MKLTLNWLRQYVDFSGSPEELEHRLTMLGIEVEGMQFLGGEFEQIVVAQVLESKQHPDADRLTVCRVHDGQGERQIVCGATNFKAGDKVPLALPGCTLPAAPGSKPVTIKTSKMRGVESQGMMCSPRELGLADDAEGLLILPDSAPVGKPFGEYMGRSEKDVVYDLEITPNRPDLNSVIGIAREIAAVTGKALSLPKIPAEIEPFDTSNAADKVDVTLQDRELCPRYTARVIFGAKVGPSPAWLRGTLEKIGVRSINNIVDVTNFVMLETGQPLHAFDYHLLARNSSGKPEIVVRRARPDETFTTLDEQKHQLTSDMLVIADPEKAVALAGIMGGLNSEIHDSTTDVLLESAYFKPQNIRATAKKLELRTDSSYRFERGADIGICDYASRRAAQLILQTAGGKAARDPVDNFPQPPAQREIILRYRKTNELLGISIPPESQSHYLHSLELQPLTRNGDESACFAIPTFRVDLKREVDLIEEIGRLHGVERIPSTPPRGAIGSHEFDAVHDHLTRARQFLTGLGLDEAQGQTLVSDAAPHPLEWERLVALKNPLSSDMNVLRSSLLPGLLDALRINLSRQTLNVALFEIGRVFLKDKEADQIHEERRLALAMTGARHAPFWQGDQRKEKIDIFDLKGIMEEFLEKSGTRGVQFRARTGTTGLFVESATLHLGKNHLGEMGQVMPSLARKYDLRDPVFLAEIDLEFILNLRPVQKSFKSLPAFPAIRRDVALVVPESVTHESILLTMRKAKPENLESIELFDVFRGKNIEEGKKSMAYALTYRNSERTLKDAEANAAHQKVLDQLKKDLSATVRE